MPRLCAVLSILVLAVAAAAADNSRSLTFAWDFAPLDYDLDIGNSFGREISRNGSFDKNDRASLRYVSDMGQFGANSGWFGGGEIAYSRYADEDLRFETLAFSGILGVFLDPKPWLRLSAHARLGMAFDNATITYDLLNAAAIDSGVLDYGTTGIQYGLGVASDFIVSKRLILSVFAGIQGEYASAVSWMYYYSYPTSYVEVETFGASFGSAIGVRF